MFTRALRHVVLTGSFLGLSCCASLGPPDSVSEAKKSNDSRFAQNAPMKKAATFLVEMADARMMDAREGEVASSRGVRADVKAYGLKMVNEQAVLLEEIRALAAAEGVQLPQTIGSSKEAGLKDLQSKTGKDVDTKFMKMIEIDHERDVKEFTKATQYENAAVREFAQRRLPMIQEHLDEIRNIKNAN